MKSVRSFLASLLVLSLVACGGGGDSNTNNDNNGNQNPPLKTVFTTLELQSYIQSSQLFRLRVVDTNTDFVGDSPVYDVGSKLLRWNIERDGLIPIRVLDDQIVVQEALNEMEQAIGKVLFDRVTLANVPEADIRRGLILKRGEPPFDGTRPPNNCGRFWVDGIGDFINRNIGLKDQTSSYFPNLYNHIDYVKYPELQNRYYTGMVGTVMVNSGNINATCNNIKDLYIHELSHALGLTNHFEGFGMGVENKNAYLQALRLMYANSPGTDFNQLTP